MPLYNKVKQHREDKGINQTDLAKMCGVSRQTVSSIERGDYHPSVLLAIKLAEYFGTHVEELFQYKEDNHG